MRFRLALLILLITGSLFAQQTSTLPDTLWAIPCGPMVGTMESGARIQVIDTVAGWARVSMEGWIPLITALKYLPQDTTAAPENVESGAEEFHQCEATTQKGTQCSRRAMKGSRYCWQHQNYEKGKK
jgi:hypothetical protein